MKNYTKLNTQLIQRLKSKIKELKTLEEKWRSLIQNAPNVILIVDKDHIVRFINHPKGKETVEETIGRKVYDYILKKDHTKARKAMNQVFATGKPKTFESVAGPKGHQKWYDTIVGPVTENKKITAVALITTDITKQKNAEYKLIQQKEKFKNKLKKENGSA